MSPRQLDRAIARITGESVRTIRQRGFELLRVPPDVARKAQRKLSLFQSLQAVTAPSAAEDQQTPASEF